MIEDKMAYPYILTTDKLKEFLRDIPKVGIPDKVSQAYLKSRNYKSSNHKSIILILRHIGFINSDGSPSDRWRSARGNLKSALNAGIKEGYKDLYHVYPDAHLKDIEALTSFFATNTDRGGRALSATVHTFKALCSLTEFSENDEESVEEKPSPKSTPKHKVDVEKSRNFGVSADLLPININIQLHLPSDPSGDVYEKFFAAMREHLFDNKK